MNMKKNLLIRILAALGGLTLCLSALFLLAESVFSLALTEKLARVMAARDPLTVLAALLIAILLGALGVCCLMMLSSRRTMKHTGFVMQKGENGMIGVSVRSIEGMVQTCVKQHEVIASAEVSVVDRRDGIVILLNVQEAAGVNIPLAVGALQKQIRQYVSECTGMDVHEVRVLVENTENGVGASPFAVKEPAMVTSAAEAAQPETSAEAPAEAAAAPVLQEQQTEAIEAAPAELPEEVIEALPVVQETPAVQAEPAPAMATVPVPVVIPPMPELLEDEDDRPLHQRLFGAAEEPVFVPAPPELVVEPAVEEAPAEASAEAEEPVPAEAEADDVAPDAVLEVIAAMAEEEAEQDEEKITPAESNEI